MATHRVTLTVSLVMDEMDGTAEESAEIALGIVDDLIGQWDKTAEVRVSSYGSEE